MILSVEDLTYRYPGAGDPALRDVSLEIAEGDVCLLVGLSGDGKSTLLRAACGLVPHFHGGSFAGTVRIAGMSTREHGPAQTSAAVGVLFQDPETQLVMSSVRAEISTSLSTRGWSPSAVARGVEEVALALGVDHLLDRRTAELSGGEKQRVALAAALAGRPRLVLLDEPTSQLDPVAGDELIGLLRRLNREWDTTILIAEHRIERCLDIADRVIAMERGRIVHDGDPRSLLRWAASHAPALQTPGARLLDLLGVGPPPVGVRDARARLRTHGLLADEHAQPAGRLADEHAQPARRLADEHAQPAGRLAGALGHPARRLADEHAQTAGRPRPDAPSPPHELLPSGRRTSRLRWSLRRGDGVQPALEAKGLWHEMDRGAAILRGISVKVMPGECVAVMGRNGAGKSTLLAHLAGLRKPTRGQVRCAGRVALLLQNPGDYLLRDTVAAEASQRALREVGLSELVDRNPRDLSGGERQRLALAIVTDGEQSPAVLALDEPTRGMDRAAKATLAADLRRRAGQGQAVIVATHEPEFAAAIADRVVMLADGRVIADGLASELLAGGWYFATETARILRGLSGALLPEEGAKALRAAHAEPPVALPEAAA